MIERQIDSPNPIPSGFVVKKASKMRSTFAGSSPVPVSVTAISTLSGPSIRELTRNTRGWRVTAPNLEDCGLLTFGYEGLNGEEGLLGEAALWNAGFSVREGREAERFIDDGFMILTRGACKKYIPISKLACLTLLDVPPDWSGIA